MRRNPSKCLPALRRGQIYVWTVEIDNSCRGSVGAEARLLISHYCSSSLALAHEDAGKLMLIISGDAAWRYELLTHSPMITFPKLPVLLSKNSAVILSKPSLQFTS